jgi:cytidyltransferase-like protein
MLIKEKEQLKEVIDLAKKEGKRVLIKRGVFDIIHPGHIYTAQKLKEKTDVLIILLVSDELTKEKKGSTRPINNVLHRAKVVDGLKGVDYTYCDESLNREEYVELLNYLKPNLLAVTLGDEKKTKSYTSPHWDLIEIADKQEVGFSTTQIINKILENYKNT